MTKKIQQIRFIRPGIKNSNTDRWQLTGHTDVHFAVMFAAASCEKAAAFYPHISDTHILAMTLTVWPDVQPKACQWLPWH